MQSIRIKIGCIYNCLESQLVAVTIAWNYNWFQLQLMSISVGWNWKLFKFQLVTITNNCNYIWFQFKIIAQLQLDVYTVYYNDITNFHFFAITIDFSFLFTILLEWNYIWLQWQSNAIIFSGNCNPLQLYLVAIKIYCNLSILLLRTI